MCIRQMWILDFLQVFDLLWDHIVNFVFFRLGMGAGGASHFFSTLAIATRELCMLFSSSSSQLFKFFFLFSPISISVLIEWFIKWCQKLRISLPTAVIWMSSLYRPLGAQFFNFPSFFGPHSACLLHFVALSRLFMLTHSSLFLFSA